MTAVSRRPTDHVSADTEPGAPSIDELDKAICTLARQMNADTYRMLMLVREFDERMGWKKWSFRSCAEWLAWRCGLSPSAAREKVRTAHALRELSTVSAAFADGRLSYSKVRALTRVVQTYDEDVLVAYALQATAVQVEERCQQIRNASPDGSIGGALRAWERRSVTLWRNEARGMMTINVEVPIADGEVIAKAIERAVAAGDVAMGVEFAAASKGSGARDSAEAAASGNGWKAQQADALVAIAKAYRGGGCAADDDTRAHPASVGDHYQVVIHVDDSALRGGAGRSDLPIDTVKRLSCDGNVVTIVEDDNGTPLGVGRKRRTVSTPLKRALLSRDRHCLFPGCQNKRYVEAHHIRHWADGGDTSLENLTLLCSHHHTLLHEGGFGIRRDPEGAIYFQRPDGRVIPRHGYRIDDMQDDFATPENASAEARAAMPGRSAPAEVRESAGLYLIRTGGGPYPFRGET